jgi:hypothetical protein
VVLVIEIVAVVMLAITGAAMRTSNGRARPFLPAQPAGPTAATAPPGRRRLVLSPTAGRLTRLAG